MKVLTACTLDCGDTCALIAQKDAFGRITLKGRPDHPITAGFTCRKARNIVRRLTHPERILKPRLKTRSGWQEISWDQALDLCARKIQEYRAEPASILHYEGPGDMALLKRTGNLIFGSLGASGFSGSLCLAAGAAAVQADFGTNELSDLTDLLKARNIVVWARDLERSAVHLAAIVARARRKGAKVYSISPTGTNLGLADHLIGLDPGTDRFLAAALIRRLMDQGRIEERVAGRVANFQDFKQLLTGRPERELADLAGVNPQDLDLLYDAYAGGGPTATVFGWGLQRYAFGGENVRFIDALAFLSGQVGVSGGGVYYHHAYLDSFNLDWLNTPGAPARRTFPKPLFGPEILSAQNPPVRMIWVNGANPVNQSPEAGTTAQAFEAVEFKVVVEAFLTDTAERADLVLPAALMLEKEDLIGSALHHDVLYVGKVTDPPAEAKSDYWIFRELGRRLDPPVDIPPAEDLLRRSLNSPLLETTLEEIRQTGQARAKRPQVAFQDLAFGHPDGLFRLPVALHDEPPAPPEFPLRLLSLIRREAMHSQILPDEHPRPLAWVSPEEPAVSRLDPTQPVFLVSPHGRLRVEIRTDGHVRPGVVVYRRGDWMKLGGGINQVIKARLTDLGQGAAYYDQFVRLEN